MIEEDGREGLEPVVFIEIPEVAANLFFYPSFYFIQHIIMLT
jgi:hypothetical protein